MSVGYEGLVLLDCDSLLTGGTPLLCTSYSAPEQRTKIESDSLIGGRTLPLASNDYTPFIGKPHVFDWSDNTGSMTFDVTESSALAIKNWIINKRTIPVTIAMFNNTLTSVLLENCFWNSIDFSANENSFITCTINFIAIDRTDEIGNDYISNRLGLINTGIGNFNFDYIKETALNNSLNKNPLPYWKGTMQSDELLSNYAEVLNWRVNFNQTVERVFSCQATFEAVPPSIIGIGEMAISGDLELYVKNSSYNLNNILNIEELILNLNTVQFTFSDLDMDQHSIDGGSQSDVTTLSLSYSAYGFSD